MSVLASIRGRYSIGLRCRIVVSAVIILVLGMTLLTAYVASAVQSDVRALMVNQLNTMASYAAADVDSKIGLRLKHLEQGAKQFNAEILADPKKALERLTTMGLASGTFIAAVGVKNERGDTIAISGAYAAQASNDAILGAGTQLEQSRQCGTAKAFSVQAAPMRDAVLVLQAPICSRSGSILGFLVGIVPLSDPAVFGQIAMSRAVDGSYMAIYPHGLSGLPEAVPGGSLARGRPQEVRVLRNLTTVGLYVVAAMPEGVITAALNHINARIVLVAAALTILVAALSLVVVTSLMGPLMRAAHSLKRFAEGKDTLHSLPLGRRDEVGELIESFNMLVEERKAVEARFDLGARYDALTGLPNRLMLQEQFDAAAQYGIQNNRKVGVLFLDLDNFKNINDSLGHFVGDGLLKAVAHVLMDCVTGYGTVGRLGGDEYMVLLRDIDDVGTVLTFIENIKAKLSEPITVEGHALLTSVSIGAAVFPDHGLDFEALHKNIDTAMYQAKEAGKDTHCFFDVAMDIDSVERINMRAELKRAIDRSEFELYYQPQIDLLTREIIGVEALIRWNHPERGLVMPGQFIATAEDSGLIVPIGEWVLRQACMQAAAWRQAGLPDMVMAVNLSALQFNRGNLEQTVVSALATSGLEAQWLELELTESILIKNPEQVLQAVQRLKSLGVKLSIDDFGTGYSSLAYLKKFAVDKIKIDQSFVRGIETDTENAAIVRAIIQIARSLNLKTIAEGVEDQASMQLLRVMRCDEGQGYLFAKPMTAALLEDFVLCPEGQKKRFG